MKQSVFNVDILEMGGGEEKKSVCPSDFPTARNCPYRGYTDLD